MRTRINTAQTKIDGLDWAIFAAYTGAYDLSTIESKLSKKEALTKNIEFYFSDKGTDKRLKKLSTNLKISKSEVVRLCLQWLTTQQNYPKNFKRS